MNFSTPERILSTIRMGDSVARSRAENRLKVNNAINCYPPLKEEEAKKQGLKINVNWGELLTLISQARRQYMTAFWGNNNFFRVKLPFAPAEHQSEWETFITENINRFMRESLEYYDLHNSKWASVVSHGIGPTLYRNEDDWCGDYLAVEDFRVPTNTLTSFKQMDWFCARHAYTPGELLKEAFSDKPNNHWSKKKVAEILKNYKELNFDSNGRTYNLETDVEKIAEIVREDGGFFTGDSMPSIPLYHFYFKDDTKKDNEGFFMRILPETGAVHGGDPDEFLWTSEKPIAKKREHILQCQFGDLSAKAPFHVYSIRSLGYALLEPCFYTNLARCKLLQHIFDNFNPWLRITDPIDKARAQLQEFANFSVLKTGVSVIPQTERHQIDGRLVETAMAQLKQLQQEASSSYTQSIDNGTSREQTAFETSVKLQQVNAMMTGLLSRAFIYENQDYIEKCRRFCRPNSQNEDVKEFQKLCKDAGIPVSQMNPKFWRVEAVTPLGMGNPTMATAEAQQLGEISPECDPTAQREILHERLLVITKDPRKAARWAPLGKDRGVTDGQRDSQYVFGTLIQGVPVPIKEGLSVIDQIEAMLPLFAGKIVLLENRDNMATPDEASGLVEVNNYLEQLVQRLAQNPQEKQRVKQYSDSLGKLMNQVKGLSQRGQEHAQQQNMNGEGQPDPNAIAKASTTHMMGKMKMDLAAEKAKQTQAEKEKGFVLDQRRKDAATHAQIQRDNLNQHSPSESISYKDAPPSIKRQMEAQAGMVPATEEETKLEMEERKSAAKPKPEPDPVGK